MSEERGRRLGRGDVFGVVQRYVGAVYWPTEAIAHGVVLFIPATAPEAGRLTAATAELEAEGCAVEVEDLGESDPRGQWRVTVTAPGWPGDAGRA
jgi:hypothetical protein